MKSLLLVGGLLLTSCADQHQVQHLIGAYVKKNLRVPISYQPISFGKPATLERLYSSREASTRAPATNSFPFVVIRHRYRYQDELGTPITQQEDFAVDSIALTVNTLRSVEEHITGQDEVRAVQRANRMEHTADSLLQAQARHPE